MKFAVLPFLVSPAAVVALRGKETTLVDRRSLKGKGKGKGPPSPSCKIVPYTTKIAIYVGGGSITNGGIGPNSAKWAEAFVAFWKTGMKGPVGSGFESTLLNADRVTFGGDSSISYVTLSKNEIEDCYDGDLSSLELFVMPGGSAYEIQDALGSDGKSAIAAYLNNGGNYVGFCAGGYYLAKGYYWKGNDGAPTQSQSSGAYGCVNNFCRYETSGTYSYDDNDQDFTVHEWGGTSYHSNLLAYGPLANVLLEGPIEEIAGPWNPPAYDSKAVDTSFDEGVPPLRQIYYGGATENYIYTDSTAAPWGTEHAHFKSSPSDGDLEFPSNLWTLKSVPTGNGGQIMISSAHIEASLFHTDIGDGGMTECQQYNNYAFLANTLDEVMSLDYTTPAYDTTCSADRAVDGEAKDTSSLFSGGLAYALAPRIANAGGGGDPNGGGCDPALINFDDGCLVGTLTGSARRPWTIDSDAGCDGTSKQLTAGKTGGVDFESMFTLSVPDGVNTMSYFYSYPSALDSGDDFHVKKNGSLIKSYENGPGVTCATDSLSVSPGDTIQFLCKSGGNGETCSIDQINFLHM